MIGTEALISKESLMVHDCIALLGVTMRDSNILQDLGKDKKEIDHLVKKVTRDSTLIPQVIEGVKSPTALVRFGSAKILRRLSEIDPELLYPYWDHFVERLSEPNTFLKADAMLVIANLAVVDSGGKFEKAFDKFFSHLNDESMIPAASAAGISGKLALAKPNLQTKIVNRLVRIDDTDHGSECKNIIKGKVIESFEEFYEETSAANKRKMVDFVKGEIRNRRKSTRKKAEKFMAKHG
jgi:hypothetical protein